MDDNRILLIRTGGTIDSEPYADPYNPPKYVDTLKGKNSLIMRTVAKLPNHENVDGLSWGTWDEDRFVKDSQKFDVADIKILADIIRDDDRKYFVITHGTDAMVKNATALQAELKNSGKTVVFAGAMVPLSMHDKHKSDGVDALQFAIEHVAQQSAGVYIIGRDSQTKRLAFFDPTTVEKDRAASKADLSFTLARTR